MDNLSLMEINEIRPFFSKAYNNIRKLEEISNNNELEEQDSQSYNMSRNSSHY